MNFFSTGNTIGSVKNIENAIVACLIGYGFFSVFNIAWGNALIDFALVLTFIRLGFSRSGLNPDKKILSFMAVYWGVLACASVFAFLPAPSLQPLWRSFYFIGPPFFLGSLFFQSKSQRQRALFLLSIVIAGMASSSCVFWQAMSGQGRTPGFIDLLELAGELSLLIPMLLVVTLQNEYDHRIRWISAIALLFAIGALVLNGTRGAWVAVGFTCGGYLFYSLAKRSMSRIKVTAIVVLLILAPLIIIQIFPATKNRVLSVVNTKDISLGHRFAMWPSAWDMFLDHFLLGVGLGNYHEQYLTKYVRVDLVQKYIGNNTWLLHQHPHNSFLYLLAETGLLGLLSFLLLYCFVLYHFLSRIRNKFNKGVWAASAFMAVVGFLIFGLTENVVFGMNQYTQSLWLLIGVSWNANE